MPPFAAHSADKEKGLKMNRSQLWFGIFKHVALPALVTTLVLLAPAAFMPTWAAVAYVGLVTAIAAKIAWQTVVNNNPPRWLKALGF